LKYGNDECAWRLSKVRHYWAVATRNIKMAHDSGDMIIRHLVLPGHLECCTRRVLQWISENTPRALVNVMDQYRPEHLVLKYPEKYKEIARRLRRDEILEAYKMAEEFKLEYKQVS
ncbi:MAG: radical SAM protein, partial [Thermogladius sp.]